MLGTPDLSTYLRLHWFLRRQPKTSSEFMGVDHFLNMWRRQPFIMGSIESLVELYRVGWLLCLFAGESFFEINQEFSPSRLHKSSAR
jgi:hypothetical protein